MRRDKPTELLAKIPLFSSCSQHQLREIARMLKPVTHHEGKTLCKSGDLGIGLHIITDGRARVAIKGRTMARLEPGDFFGELALIDGGHRTADVIAESVVETLALSAWSLKTLLRKNPSVALRMLEELAKRLRSANAQLSD